MAEPSRSHNRTGTIFISELLASFASQRGRTLSPRARRSLDELIERLSEYLEEHNVTSVARIGGTGGPGVASLSGVIAWIDTFEQHEMFDALAGEREKLRVADGALRALPRYLGKVLN